MKSTQKNLGITLIALVLTIIVLLILAGVSIASLMGLNGLLTRANDAKNEMEKAGAKEKVQVEIAGSFDNTGKLDVNRLSQNLQNIEGIDKTNLPISSLPEIVIVENNEMVIDKNGNISNVATIPPTTQVDKVTIFKDSKSENKKVVIPKGFKVSEVENEQIIDKGLVVIAPDESEFIWVPVDKKTLCVDEITDKEVAEIVNGTDYRGVLYSIFETMSTKIKYSESGYREPAYLADSVDGDANTSEGHNKIVITQGLVQKEYNGIINSIKEHGGFYIGRYESSLSDSDATTAAITGHIQSKKGVMPTSAANEETKTWYGLYTKQKEYSEVINTQYKTEVKSGMIYGSMYDAVMNWALYGTDKTDANKVAANSTKHGPEKTGALESDVIKNIYDLGNNLREWTVECYNTNYRVRRGGYSTIADSPSYRHDGIIPGSNSSALGSRMLLYL